MSQNLETQGATSLSVSLKSPPATPGKSNNVNPNNEDNAQEGKRGRESVGSLDSPGTISQPPHKRADLQNSATKHKGPKNTAFVKPLYPSHEDRKEVEDAAERGTRVKIMGIEIPGEPRTTPYDKVVNEEIWDYLVKQKDTIASEIETISTDLLKQTLEEKK